MRDLRVGLVGAGGVGARHATTLGGLEGVRLVAVADLDGDRARLLATEHDARVHPDLGLMLESERLDAVWLCVPPFAHGECERTVLEAGVPFFVEKPLDLDLRTAEDVASVVAERGTVTGTGYHWRCMPGVERAAEVFQEAPVRVAHGTWWDKIPPVPWWLRRAMSGGQLIEQVTHLMDLMRFLVGEPHSVAAHPATVPDGIPISLMQRPQRPSGFTRARWPRSRPPACSRGSMRLPLSSSVKLPSWRWAKPKRSSAEVPGSTSCRTKECPSSAWTPSSAQRSVRETHPWCGSPM